MLMDVAHRPKKYPTPSLQNTVNSRRIWDQFDFLIIFKSKSNTFPEFVSSELLAQMGGVLGTNLSRETQNVKQDWM